MRPAFASTTTASALPTSPTSSQGYICYGNWKDLCNLGNVEDELPKNVSKRDIREKRTDKKRQKYESLTMGASVSAAVNNVTTVSPSPSTSVAPTTTLFPSLASSFPLPVPSQTDCSSNYEW
ncbi:hypothetical protein SEUCBS140593_004918 [Sporothrix eucalyptigena]|uniref:Uncharacterized protein n=1 Tax=Sporothrix eucalyptigena TaxID=1812306 RepID=A0ABP0BSY1_9PEZI